MVDLVQKVYQFGPKPAKLIGALAGHFGNGEATFEAYDPADGSALRLSAAFELGRRAFDPEHQQELLTRRLTLRYEGQGKCAVEVLCEQRRLPRWKHAREREECTLGRWP